MRGSLGWLRAGILPSFSGSPPPTRSSISPSSSLLLVSHLCPLFLLSLLCTFLFIPVFVSSPPHPPPNYLSLSLSAFFISCVGQWTARAMALTDLPAGLLRAALSSGLWRKKPPALKQLCGPGSERTMKNAEKKERKFNGPLGIVPPRASLLLFLSTSSLPLLSPPPFLYLSHACSLSK